ncbi:MAG: response regulator [Actinobacteria bacterium]|nr:response regulator [Actinomycetota bacterium]
MEHELIFRPGGMPPLFGDTAATLIVDDDPAIAVLLCHILEPEGYHCTIAENAAQARARVEESDYALALVDVMMPGESGLELAAELVRSHPDLAVVMVTGIDDSKIADLAIDTGAYGYVIKPFSVNHVLVIVANAGRRRCLEIERRVYERRLERRVDEQAADLDEALIQLKETTNPPD